MRKVFKYVKGCYKEDGSQFSMDTGRRTWIKSLICCKGLGLVLGGEILHTRTVKYWDMLPMEAIDSFALNIFKNRWEKCFLEMM